MAELAANRFDYGDPDNEIIILYAELEDGKAFEEILKQTCGDVKTMLWKVGPVIGGHAGPGVVGMSFLAAPDNKERAGTRCRFFYGHAAQDLHRPAKYGIKEQIWKGKRKIVCSVLSKIPAQAFFRGYWPGTDHPNLEEPGSFGPCFLCLSILWLQGDREDQHG